MPVFPKARATLRTTRFESSVSLEARSDLERGVTRNIANEGFVEGSSFPRTRSSLGFRTLDFRFAAISE
jgi:hypothetical protein